MKQQDPDLVSIIIPTFNRADLLVQAIDSARVQTWTSIQIIVVDDGSTDDTRARVAEMPDVCYVYQKNAGQAAARNTGLRYAEGPFICSLDSDDLWHPEFLERCITAMRELNADLGFANWVSQNQEGIRYPSYFENTNEWYLVPEAQLANWRFIDSTTSRAMFNDACIAPSSAFVIRREVLQTGWTDTFRVADDWCMLLDCVMLRDTTIAFTMRPLWVKRISGDNICDERDIRELLPHFYVHDYRLIAKRFAAHQSAREKALWRGRLAISHIKLAKWEFRKKLYFSSASLLIKGLWDLLITRVLAPDMARSAWELILLKKSTGLRLLEQDVQMSRPVLVHEE